MINHTADEEQQKACINKRQMAICGTLVVGMCLRMLISDKRHVYMLLYRPFGYERVYLSLCKVADTHFYIQGDDIKTY